MGIPCSWANSSMDWMFSGFYFSVEFVVADISIVYVGSSQTAEKGVGSLYNLAPLELSCMNFQPSSPHCSSNRAKLITRLGYSCIGVVFLIIQGLGFTYVPFLLPKILFT